MLHNSNKSDDSTLSGADVEGQIDIKAWKYKCIAKLLDGASAAAIQS